MDMITVTAKTVDEAVTKALIELETTSDKLEYEVVDKGSAGFLGIGAKPAIIRAKKKETIADKAIEMEIGARGLRSIMEKLMTDIMFAYGAYFDVKEEVEQMEEYYGE